MSISEVMEDLFFIERGYLNSNHFVYRSKDLVLIDTGYISDFSETERLITSLAIDLSDTRLIISTHCHCDHIGGNKIIQKKSGCNIILHKIGKYFIDTQDDWATWWRYYNQKADFFSCTKALEEGDILSIGPHEFHIFHVPGHASDQIVLYNKKEKVLLSSDALWENDMAVVTLRVEGSRALFSIQESLEKLERLDVKVVYPGHGKPFTDMQAAIAKSRQRIKGYMDNKESVGSDVLKKIIIYTIMMNRIVEEETFFFLLMSTHWFKETVDFYFSGEYKAKYDEIMDDFLRRDVIKRNNGTLFTTVKP
jgi:glyoxylase-like metal-dependent hydrolase (beta-lactamase superfamily II)